MTDLQELIAFHDTLTSEQVRALRRRLREEPAAARLFERWCGLRSGLGGRIGAVDRETFCLVVLSEVGLDEYLTEDDLARVREAEPVIKASLDQSVGLEHVADDIRNDACAFSAMWENWFQERSALDGDRSQRPARDRRAARPARTRRWAMRAGVGTALFVFVALLFFVARRDYGSVTVATAANEVRMIELADGSSVRLLGGSRLRYVPGEGATLIDRQAELEGRAFFDISPSASGFIVKTPQAQAVVLGTSFGVDSGVDHTEIVLTDGMLALSARDAVNQVVVLEPGQMSRVATGAPPSSPVDVDLNDHLSWTGLFLFQATSLADVTGKLTVAYGAPIDVDPVLLEERITGRFERSQDLPAILNVVAAAIGGRVVESNGAYRLEAPE